MKRGLPKIQDGDQVPTTSWPSKKFPASTVLLILLALYSQEPPLEQSTGQATSKNDWLDCPLFENTTVTKGEYRTIHRGDQLIPSTRTSKANPGSLAKGTS
ncbi:hypothetical protein AMTR_s00005p00090980 [Amborella trichopoda]|uniref:Uncharacterized protein n=1 Tax=Amborella trichopoda TaxID=13333 RepID=W1PFM5_AMBTC|nr:hypothetical protein AMTR_s00005p00090980 [Amborella trichopoda]